MPIRSIHEYAKFFFRKNNIRNHSIQNRKMSSKDKARPTECIHQNNFWFRPRVNYNLSKPCFPTFFLCRFCMSSTPGWGILSSLIFRLPLCQARFSAEDSASTVNLRRIFKDLLSAELAHLWRKDDFSHTENSNKIFKCRQVILLGGLS